MSPFDPESDTNPFRPGDVFASRYRMIDRIASGPGEVWRADDLVLKIPVALKLIAPPVSRVASASSVRRARATDCQHPADAGCSTSVWVAGSSIRWSS
jgi:hypothetical protein